MSNCTVSSSQRVLACVLLSIVTLCVGRSSRALELTDQVKINEVSYDPNEVVNGSEEPYEYIELYNAGSTTAYLDGAAISDEGGNGTSEATFVFPGGHGGTSIPLAPGAFLLLVVDATGSPWGGGSGGNGLARFEFYAGGTDSDEPTTPNLIKTAGMGLDLSFANAGDGVTLSTGVSTGSVIPCAEIVDGVSWETGGTGDTTPLSNTVCTDPSPHPGYTNGGASLNQTLQRNNDGIDTNTSSSADFQAAVRSPGAPNTRTNTVGIYADSTASLGGALCAPIGTRIRCTS